MDIGKRQQEVWAASERVGAAGNNARIEPHFTNFYKTTFWISRNGNHKKSLESQPCIGLNEPTTDELLAIEEFTTLLESNIIVEDSLQNYNLHRPHSTLKYQTSDEFTAEWHNNNLGSKKILTHQLGVGSHAIRTVESKMKAEERSSEL
jgi:hypothetical protein